MEEEAVYLLTSRNQREKGEGRGFENMHRPEQMETAYLCGSPSEDLKKKIKGRLKKKHLLRCAVLHASNPSTWEVSFRRIRRSSLASLKLHSKFKARLNYVRPFL